MFELVIPPRVNIRDEFSEWQAINGVSVQSLEAFRQFLSLFAKNQKFTKNGFGIRFTEKQNP